MHFLNFKSCPADPDVWMRPAIKSDRTNIWDIVLIYTDNTLDISENAESIQELRCGWLYVRCVFHILAWVWLSDAHLCWKWMETFLV
jgi:hypothetical protein